MPPQFSAAILIMSRNPPSCESVLEPKATEATQSHPKATLKPPKGHILGIDSGVQSHPKATPKPPQGYPKAPPRLPQGSPKATSKPGASQVLGRCARIPFVFSWCFLRILQWHLSRHLGGPGGLAVAGSVDRAWAEAFRVGHHHEHGQLGERRLLGEYDRLQAFHLAVGRIGELLAIREHTAIDILVKGQPAELHAPPDVGGPMPFPEWRALLLGGPIQIPRNPGERGFAAVAARLDR